MVEQERGVGGDVGLARVARVVAVALEEPDHLVLGVEEVGAAVVLRDRPVEGAVVGDREGGLVAVRIAGRARRGARVQAVAAVLVVGLPRRVGRPDQHVRVRRVVADHERDLARAAVVVAYQPGDVDAGDRGGRDRPRRRHAPVATIDQTRRRVGQAGGLGLGQARRRADVGLLQARAVALVVAQPVDVDVVGRGGRLDLEADRPADVDAHRRGVALDGRVAGPADLPGARRRARLLVLACDGVRARGHTGGGERSEKQGGRRKGEGQPRRHLVDHGLGWSGEA